MLPRDAYIAKMEARLMAWADELAWLRSQAELVSTHGSVEFQQELEFAQGKHELVRRQFEGLKKSGKNSWTELAVGVDTAWRELTS
jgi:hypothetical protein